MKKLILFSSLALLSLTAFAQEVTVRVLQPVKSPVTDLGIGSRVELDFKTRNIKKPAIFLGRMVTQDGRAQEFLFLDEQKTRISMIDPENVTGFRKATSQAIISPIDQQGSTCTAYGVFHFWGQMNEVGYRTPPLMSVMKSDRARMQLLEETIDIYYIQNKTNITTLMKMWGNRFGFNCRNNPFTNPRQAADFLFQKTMEGKPVMIDFNIGSDMVASTYEMTDFETPVSRDPRLWLPRKVGQRMTSGHVIVAAGAFISRGRRKLLVLDSNWTEPRVWDLDRYLGSKVAVKEMGFHTCN